MSIGETKNILKKLKYNFYDRAHKMIQNAEKIMKFGEIFQNFVKF